MKKFRRTKPPKKRQKAYDGLEKTLWGVFLFLAILSFNVNPAPKPPEPEKKAAGDLHGNGTKPFGVHPTTTVLRGFTVGIHVFNTHAS